MDMDYEDLLVFAIKKEDKSIKLYNDLAKIVKDKDFRQVLLFLVNEEPVKSDLVKSQLLNVHDAKMESSKLVSLKIHL